MAVQDSATLLWEPRGGHNPARVYGGNSHLYRAREDAPAVLVDAGAAFAGTDADGDVLSACHDLSRHFANRFDRSHRPADPAAGIVLTHWHADHIGSIAPFARLGFEISPIYGSPFTLAMLRFDLIRHGVDPVAAGLDLRPLHPGETAALGGLSFSAISLPHSTPGAFAFDIKGDDRRILHSGDFKLDPTCRMGEPPEMPALEALGASGDVDAAIVDSSGADKAGRARTEAEIEETIGGLIDDHRPWRLVVSGYTHHLERLATAMAAAAQRGMGIIVEGRDMKVMVEAARASGHDWADILGADVPIVSAGTEAARGVAAAGPHLVLCPGAQGEPGGTLARAANGVHPWLRFDKGDMVINLSKPWGGNAEWVTPMHEKLRAAGAMVITPDDAPIYGGGHAHQDELWAFYDAVRPAIAVPTHSEARELDRHAELLAAWELPALRVDNGTVTGFTEAGPRVVGKRPAAWVQVPAPEDEVDLSDPLGAIQPIPSRALIIPDAPAPSGPGPAPATPHID